MKGCWIVVETAAVTVDRGFDFVRILLGAGGMGDGD